MNPFYESQKLVHCKVINQRDEESVRLVEIDAFKLWRYLMTHKHGLRVESPSLCLWISKTEYDANPDVFDHAGRCQSVDRILIELYDEDYGFAQTSTRYAPQQETPKLLEILKSHIPVGLRDSDDCSVDVIPGVVVQHMSLRVDRPMILGLESQAEA